MDLTVAYSLLWQLSSRGDKSQNRWMKKATDNSAPAPSANTIIELRLGIRSHQCSYEKACCVTYLWNACFMFDYAVVCRTLAVSFPQ